MGSGTKDRISLMAIRSGIVALVLWLASYSWVPFAAMGRERPPSWLLGGTEVAGLLAGLLAIGLGFIARKRTQGNSADRGCAFWGLVYRDTNHHGVGVLGLDISYRIHQVLRPLQKELASLSTRGTHIIVEDSGHAIQDDRPDVVVDAIRQVVEAIRSQDKMTQ